MNPPHPTNTPTQDDLLFHDHHSHPLLYSAFLSGVDLSDASSFEDAAEQICDSQIFGKLTVAHHWKSNKFEINDDELEKLPPVAIFDNSLHGLKLNSAATQILSSEFGEDVEKVSDQDWYERNFRMVLNWFAMLGGSSDTLLQFYKHLETLGIETAEELLLVNESEILWFEIAGLSERTTFWASPDVYQQLSDDSKPKVHGTKLFTDGAFGSRTAAVAIPYIDQHGIRGKLLYQNEQLQAIVENVRQ